MMTNIRIWGLGIWWLSFPVLVLAQSPWARQQGGVYMQASYQTISTYGSLFGDGVIDITLDRLVREQQLQLYGEFGLSKRTTLVVVLPYVMNERGAENPDSPYQFAVETTGSIKGVGNTQLAVRHQFKTGRIALAGTLKVAAPAIPDAQPFADLRAGYHAWTIQPMISAGMGLGRFYGFAYGGAGFRTNNYSHFANAGVEAGLRWWKCWFIAFSDIMLSFENGSRPLTGIDALTGLYANDQGWVSLGVKTIVSITPQVGLTASFAGAAWAQRVPKSPGISAGLFLQLE